MFGALVLKMSSDWVTTLVCSALALWPRDPGERAPGLWSRLQGLVGSPALLLTAPGCFASKVILAYCSQPTLCPLCLELRPPNWHLRLPDF